MEEYYRAKFLISPKAGVQINFLDEIVTLIKRWLQRKYGVAIIKEAVPDWRSVPDGGNYTDEKSGKFRIISEVANRSTWSCRIKEYPPCKSGFIPRVWVTEIGLRIRRNGAAEAFCSALYGEIPGFSGNLLPKPALNIPTIAKFLITSEKWLCVKCDSATNTDSDSNGICPVERFGVDECQKQKESPSNCEEPWKKWWSGRGSAVEVDEAVQDHPESVMEVRNTVEQRPTEETRWISLCRVKPPDKNNQIWLQRLADSENGTLEEVIRAY